MRVRQLIAVLLLLAGLAALPGRALAAPGQESTFQDDNLLVYGDDPTAVGGTMDRLKSLGVDRLRVSVFWAVVAPDSDKEAKPSFDAADPAAYPSGAWDRYDRIVRLAQARGLAVNFDVTSPAPHWATGSLPGRPDLDKNYTPDPGEFGLFVKAVATRYSGSYVPPVQPPAAASPPSGPGIGIPRQAAAGTPPLPRVSYWTIWNEPNQPGWLTPQSVPDPRGGSGQVEASPRLYRGLVDAMWGALQATGHGKDTILLGETAPKGQARVVGPTRALKPGRFIRALYCLDRNLQFLKGSSADVRGCPVADQAARMAADHPGLFASTGYAHHPYELSFAPDHQPATDDFTTANLPALSALLRRIYQRYGRPVPGGGRDVPLYLTEFGYQTDPPDPSGVSYAKQAAYLNQAEWITFRNPRVRTLTQFLLVDDKGTGGASAAESFGGTFQSGLLTEQGAAKPALQAYAFPIHLPARRVRRGRRLRVFGLVRPAVNGQAPTVQVQLRAKDGTFRTVRTVQGTKGRGYVTTSLTPRRSGVVRLAWASGGQLTTSRNVSFKVTAARRR